MERFVVGTLVEERQDGEMLCRRWNCANGGFQDMVAFLNQIEFGEVELTTVRFPSVEVAAVGKIIVDETSQSADDEGMTIAVCFEVILNGF